jgi:hypothetical protein
MAHQSTLTRPRRQPGVWDLPAEEQQARIELLEALPARLEVPTLALVLRLTAEGKTPRSIGWRVRLDPLVIELEVRRANERAAIAKAHRALSEQEKADRAAEAAMPRLPRWEMNRLARGTHIPNQPLREMIGAALAADPHLTLSDIVKAAGYKGTSEVRRLLGEMRQSGSARVAQTIRTTHAARLVRALDRAPREVIGL